MDISKTYRSILRYHLNRKNRSRLENKDFSILSQNCVGGVILHELGLRFDTPTVNLWFSAKDFVKFLERPQYYVSCKVVECMENAGGYPVGLLDDIKIYFMHYKSFSKAKEKWEQRVERIHWDNLYVIMVEGGSCTNNLMRRFDSLDYEHKVIFTTRPRTDIQSSYCIPGSAESENAVMDLCRYKSRFTGRRWLDDFDYVSFLNQK